MSDKDFLVNWRSKMGFTQADAAEVLQVSRSVISMIETNQRRLDKRTKYACLWLEAQPKLQPDASPDTRDEIAALRDEIRALRSLVDLEAAKASARIAED